MGSLLTTFLLIGATAHAVPAQFTHQGRLLDADGEAREGDATITFRVTNAESGGDTLWEETLTVPLNSGFYSAILGVDEDGNPLDTDVLSQAPAWLELQLEGEGTMFPRSPINAVPYATMATVAEEVSGGPVDASQIAVDGTPVVNELGEWVGPAPTVNWTDIEGMPEDFADGVDDDTDTDTDTDSFAVLGTSCLDGDIPVWDSVLVEWVCGIDAVLTADEVDAIVADNGYAMESEVFSSSFLDLTEMPDGLDDGDDNTQLSESEVDGMVADNGYAMATDAFSRLFSDLLGIPEDLADGDDNTQLSEDEVDAMVADNGHALDSDVAALLTEIETLKDQVAALEEGDDSGSGTVMYGNYQATNSVDLAALRGFTEITGDLEIKVGDVPDLSPLSSLIRVGNDLKILGLSSATNLSGLDNLTYIGGELRVYEADSLLSLTGLGSLNTVEGSVRIMRNANLASFTGLHGLVTIGNEMSVTHNPSLSSFTGLTSLTDARRIEIYDNNALTSLDGLEALRSTEYLYIRENHYLTTIDALHGVTSESGYYEFADNRELCGSQIDPMVEILSALGWSGYSRADC